MGVFPVLLYGLITVISPAMPWLIRKVGKPRQFQIGGLQGAAGSLLFPITPSGSFIVALFGAILIGASSGPVNALM